jgi:hypothetical protein
VYDNAHHNVWFQMGIGGTRKSAEDGDGDSDRVEVADTLNTYLLEKINAKMAKDPSPVGLVLMNHCISKGGDLTRAIIEMNGKFYLNRKGNDVITGDGEQNGTGSGTGTETKASAYVGPDAF